MHALRQVASDLRGMSELIGEVMENPVAQAVVLDLNPFWMAAHDLARARFGKYVPDLLLFDLGLERRLGWTSHSVLSPASIGSYRFSLDYRYDTVRELNRAVFGIGGDEFQHLLARVIARPLRTTDETDRREALENAARQAPFPTVVETRLEPVPLIGPGERVVAAARGVIGGFLRDRNEDRVYGVTCGHVAGSNAEVLSQGLVVARTAHSFDPFAATPAGRAAAPVCRPNSAGVARLDMALVDMVDPPLANTVTTVAPPIQRGDLIDIAVGYSRKTYQVGGVVVTSRIKGVCFDRLFEIFPYNGGLLNPRLNALLASMPEPGDSGAWIYLAGTTEWCGILIAGEPLIAYGLEIDDVLTEANSKFGLDLELA